MREGDLVADRFVVRSRAASGGMGTVYRATDRIDGGDVALKIMDAREGEEEAWIARFQNEARLLHGLVHPAVVRYVAHGSEARAKVWLAMEWLEGEDLASCLAKSGGLDVAGSLSVARRIAEGLEAVHARGILHRDVKPSNVFLVGNDPARVKLLDFGVARDDSRGRALTRTGAIMGTVGYMAPEQATRAAELDPRVDVFALGCVLFECLTGRPAFVGSHLVTVLAKVLCEEAPRLREVRPELPASIDAMVARMLAKERSERFADASEVLRALDVIGDVSHLPGTGRASSGSRRAALLTGGEQRLLSVILLETAARERKAAPPIQADATLTAAAVGTDPVRVVAEGFGGVVHPLASGAVLITIHGSGNASDLATRAAACALSLLDASPGARLALATGRAETLGLAPSGPVIDRAGTVLRAATGSGIHVDDVTASLLETRYEVEGEGATRRLVRRRGTLTSARTLLGKPTPYVGREKELALLEATMRECEEEPVARAVLVIAEAGAGKSRLARELVARVGGADVMIARADSVGGGAALSLAKQLVRHGTGLREGEPPSTSFDRIAATCDDVRIAEILAEMVGVPASSPKSAVLSAARADPRVLREWMQRSFEDWLAAKVERRPVVIILEDVHWGDAPSVKYVSDALKRLRDRPLMVLALARPEIHETFPALFEALTPMEIRLGNLGRRAAERLVRASLGDVAPEVLARVVERADGHAFYLEELIRHVAAGGTTDFPETVLAMVQARLASLDPAARRVLRAASIFGDVAWERGIAALLGDQVEDLATWIDALAAAEILVRGRSSRFAGEREISFRHALLREATYATLTSSDRALGHTLAAEWLENVGEREALVVAEHYERGGAVQRALPWIARAARAALEADHLDAAIALGERGLNEGAEGALRAELLHVVIHAHGWRSRFRVALGYAREALTLVTPGTAEWYDAVGATVFAGVNLGDPSVVAEVVPLLLEAEGDPPPIGSFAFATVLLVIGLSVVGQRALAEMFLARMDRAAARATPEPAFVGWAAIARLHELVQEKMDLGGALSEGKRAMAAFESIGDGVGTSTARYFMAFAEFESGLYERARESYRVVERDSEARGTEFTRTWSCYWQARIAIEREDFEEASALLASYDAGRDLQLADNTRVLEAQLAWERGELAEAEELARGAVDSIFTTARATAHAVLAGVHAARGERERARSQAEAGLAGAAHAAAHPIDRMRLLSLKLENDDRPAALVAEACAEIDRILAGMPDDEARAAFRNLRPVTKILSLR
jgi:tetratricopeptide (TPR) repeat protein